MYLSKCTLVKIVTIFGTYSDLIVADQPTISILNGLANKMADFSFINLSRPRVTYFKCIGEKEEFNYSSNPSYKNINGEIIINSGSNNQNVKPATYITQIALCNDLGEIMAIAKATEPIKKDFSKKVTILARLIT